MLYTYIQGHTTGPIIGSLNMAKKLNLWHLIRGDCTDMRLLTMKIPKIFLDGSQTSAKTNQWQI